MRARQRRVPAASMASTLPALAEQADRLRQRRRDGDLRRRRREASPALSPSPIRSRPSTPEALAAAARRSGIRIVMLTGDNWTTAQAVARRLGIDEVEAEVLPEQKSARRAALQGAGPRRRDGRRRRQRRPRARRGRRRHRHGHRHRRRDGERRRHAGARATCAASCGRAACPQATMRNIRQNLFFAFIYNALGVPVAAGVLYPVFGVLLSPDDRRRGDGALLGQRDRQRAAAAVGAAVGARRSKVVA